VSEPVDTEKDVPDGLFLTSKMHKSIFGRGFAPHPAGGALMLVKVPV